MAPRRLRNETLVQALIMAACCLASGSCFGVGVRTVVRMSPSRVVRTRGAPSSSLRTGGGRDGRTGVGDECMQSFDAWRVVERV